MGWQAVRYRTKVHHVGRGLHKALSARNIDIAFNRIYADKNKTYAFYRVSRAGLPAHVRPEDLTEADIERFLTAAVGYPVKAINGNGLTFCIKLDDAPN